MSCFLLCEHILLEYLKRYDLHFECKSLQNVNQISLECCEIRQPMRYFVLYLAINDSLNQQKAKSIQI